MDLPILLAGPIVRRAQPQAVCFWLATATKIEIEIIVQSQSLAVLGSAKSVEQPLCHIQLGKNLHCYLLQVKPSQASFPDSELLYYDVRLQGKNLADLQLVNNNGNPGLNYPGHPLPGFFLQKHLRTILHGSCRRLEAGTAGNPIPDRLISGDTAIAENARDLTLRPSHLFLTGDQIYADQISAPLLAAILPLARTLMGTQESIPGINSAAQRIDPAKEKFDTRDTLLRETHAGLTTATCANHLITFGEYAAQYLFAFGDPNLLQVPDWNSVQSRFPGYPTDTLMAKVNYEQTTHLIDDFKAGLWKVRRLLANISVLMIADDHDVTDDWNIDSEWRNNVEKSAVGRALVCNALAGYWAFQGWGNDPDRYDRDFFNKLEQQLNAATTDLTREKAFQTILLQQHWEYALPSFPPCLVMDSRTGRAMDTTHKAALLLSPERIVALKNLGQQVKKQLGFQPTDAIPLLLISPTPVIGFEKIEFLQDFLPFNNAWMDRESWSANPVGRNALLELLSKELAASIVTILSGDVHYSFVRKQKIGNTRYVQCTSSALKNTPTGGSLVKQLGKGDLKQSDTYVQPSNHPYIIESEANLGRVCFDGQGNPLYQDLLIDNAGTHKTGQFIRYPTSD